MFSFTGEVVGGTTLSEKVGNSGATVLNLKEVDPVSTISSSKDVAVFLSPSSTIDYRTADELANDVGCKVRFAR